MDGEVCGSARARRVTRQQVSGRVRMKTGRERTARARAEGRYDDLFGEMPF